MGEGLKRARLAVQFDKATLLLMCIVPFPSVAQKYWLGQLDPMHTSLQHIWDGMAPWFSARPQPCITVLSVLILQMMRTEPACPKSTMEKFTQVQLIKMA
ncbi:hypothetical protein ACFX2C_043275 [Malus domestica]